MFPTFDSFREVFKELTEDCSCMVIDNTSHNLNIDDKIFWYKVDKDYYDNLNSNCLKRKFDEKDDENVDEKDFNSKMIRL